MIFHPGGYIREAILWFEGMFLLYLVSLSSLYFFLLIVAFVEVLRHRGWSGTIEEAGAVNSSLLVPPVSVLAPAYNEAMTIRESVRALLALSYPEHEVIVINDGSKDATLQILIEEFHLYQSAHFSDSSLPTKPVRAVYESMDAIRLIVVDKENGGKADALNAGINAARYPLICAVDSDSLLEQDALLRIARPMLQDPERVLAVGGIIRIANGCTTASGRVVDVNLPSKWVARFQVVEYMRAFLGGRVAFSTANCLLVVSGAFGLFRKSAVLAAGGYDTGTVGEDMELILRLHRWALERKMDYRIVFEPEAVCWTEAPESLRVLKRQRNRWQRGTIEALWKHREMIARPRYGIQGCLAMPYFVIFEGLGPLLDLAGCVISVVGVCSGVLAPRIAVLFFIAAIVNGIVLSGACVVLAEFSTRRYMRVSNVLILLGAAVLENLGFRQLQTLWRAQAFWDLWKGKKSWGTMERTGFGSPAPNVSAAGKPGGSPKGCSTMASGLTAPAE
jgi:cellulose synthase/poly-beta-1,6-N-acetylglucosamine synthase-like glycosyltransferase